MSVIQTIFIIFLSNGVALATAYSGFHVWSAKLVKALRQGVDVSVVSEHSKNACRGVS